MNSLIIDIETAGKPEAELPGRDFQARKGTKDPEKIKADIEAKKAAWLEGAALKAECGFVLVIGLFNDSGESQFLEGDEAAILKEFWKIVQASSCYMIGHNIKGFDLPFLIRRSWMNGAAVPNDIMRGRYFSERVIDTMEKWACGNSRDTISLDNLAKAFGLPGKTGDGKDFAGQYMLGGEYKKKALDYLKTDLLLTQAVAKGMGCIQ